MTNQTSKNDALKDLTAKISEIIKIYDKHNFSDEQKKLLAEYSPNFPGDPTKLDINNYIERAKDFVRSMTKDNNLNNNLTTNFATWKNMKNGDRFLDDTVNFERNYLAAMGQLWAEIKAYEGSTLLVNAGILSVHHEDGSVTRKRSYVPIPGMSEETYGSLVKAVQTIAEVMTPEMLRVGLTKEYANDVLAKVNAKGIEKGGR